MHTGIPELKRNVYGWKWNPPLISCTMLEKTLAPMSSFYTCKLGLSLLRISKCFPGPRIFKYSIGHMGKITL